MEVKIGVQHASRELVVEVDQTADAVQQQLAEALTAGSVLSLTDTKGRRVVVPAERVAYLEIGSGTVGAVGFRS